MKKILPLLIANLLIFSGIINAQTQVLASLTPGGNPTAEEVKAKPASPPAIAEVTITLKNSADKPIEIFAGPKEEIRTPKIRSFGGFSKNTLYLTASDVVCLMTPDMKPMACTNIKPGTQLIEVNTSANMISCK